MDLDAIGGDLAIRDDELAVLIQCPENDHVVVDGNNFAALSADSNFISDVEFVPVVKRSQHTADGMPGGKAVANGEGPGDTCQEDGEIVFHKLGLQLRLTQSDEDDVEQDEIEDKINNQRS